MFADTNSTTVLKHMKSFVTIWNASKNSLSLSATSNEDFSALKSTVYFKGMAIFKSIDASNQNTITPFTIWPE